MRHARLILSALLVLAAQLPAARGDDRPVDDARIDRWIAQLAEDDDEQARNRAIYELGRLGPAASRAQPALMSLLRHQDDVVRVWAVSAFLRVGGKPADVVPWLDDPSPNVRGEVAEQLLRRHYDADLVVPALVRLEAEYSNTDTKALIQALSDEGRQLATPALIEGLRDSDEEVRRAAAHILASVPPPDRRFVARLVHLLHDERPDVRENVCRLLLRIGPDAAVAIPGLRERLGTAERADALAVAAALAAIAPADESPTYLEWLIRALEVGDESQQSAAADWFRALGGRARPATGLLINRLCRPALYDSCHQSLVNIGASAVPDLIGACQRDRDPEAARLVMGVLGRLGQGAREAVPLLVDTIGNEESGGRTLVAAMNALAEIGPPDDCVPLLVVRTRLRVEEVREAAARALGRVPRLTDAAVNELESLLSSDAPGTRIAAARALAAHGVKLDVAALALAKIVRRDPQASFDAIWALQSLGPAAQPALLELVRALSSDVRVPAGFGGWSVAPAVVNPLSSIGAPAVPALQAALGNSSVQVRGLAVRALGQIGPAAKPAVAGLLKLLPDRAEREEAMGCLGYTFTIQQEVIRALGGIGPDAAETVPDLLDLLTNELADGAGYSPFASSLIDTLGKMRTGAAAAAPVLKRVVREAKQSGNDNRLAAAVLALAKIDPGSVDILPAMERFLRDLREDGPMAFGSANGIESIISAAVELGPRAEPVVPLLQEMYSAWLVLHPHYRCDAAWAVTVLKPTEQSAIDYLRTMSNHPDELFAEYARERLTRVEATRAVK